VVAEVEAKPLEVLHQLLKRAGEVVRKEELLEAVWPGVLVVDASLATAVSKLRKALDDESLIKTVPRVGYRLSVPVRCLAADDVLLPPELSAPSANFAPEPSITATSGPAPAIARRTLVVTVAALLVLALIVGLTSFRTLNRTNPIPRAVAILPFQNVGGTQDLEYLRSALPDQIGSSLSMARSLTIRPVPATGRYADPALDLRKAARELDVDRIVRGHYVLAGNELQITMEAVDTDENRVLWHDTVNVPANNLLQLQAQVAAMSKGSLARTLGITQFVTETSPPANNEQAYELYLRSLAIDWDAAPDREAIELLRKSVLLDPTYAPA
jgi:DNA-binding winged helix-turn-helix (wHTH) protein/TolB-like protein